MVFFSTFAHFPVLVVLAYGFDRNWTFSADAAAPPPTQGNTLEYRMNAVRMITGAPRLAFKRGKLHREPEEETGPDAPETDEGGFSSDPYAVVTLGAQLCKTAVRPRTLKPVWAERFNIIAAKGELIFLIPVWAILLTGKFLFI